MAVMRARIKNQGPQADMLRCLLCGFARCVPQPGNALALLIAVAELGLGNVEGLAADLPVRRPRVFARSSRSEGP